MANINFAVFNAFRKAGVEEDVAREAAEAVAHAAGERDLDALRSDFAKLRDEVQAEFAKLRGEVQADFAKLRGEVQTEFAKLREESKAFRREIDERFDRIQAEINGLMQRIVRLEERSANTNKLLWGVLLVMVLNLLKGWMIP